VPPAELEALLLTHPAVADAGVIGVPDEQAGEVPSLSSYSSPAPRPPRTTSPPSWPTRSPTTNGCTGSTSSTPSPNRRRARFCTESCATRPHSEADAKSGTATNPHDGVIRGAQSQPVAGGAGGCASVGDGPTGACRGTVEVTPGDRYLRIPSSPDRAGVGVGRGLPDRVIPDALVLPWRPRRGHLGQHPEPGIFVRARWRSRSGNLCGCRPPVCLG